MQHDVQPPPFTVIIPAHNESSVIERCLTTMLDGAPAGAVEVIVVCNGCTDDTATRARAVSPAVRVIELAQGSKPLALNTGNAHASHVPRLFVDADIMVTYRALAATADALRQPDVMAAAPALHLHTNGCGLLVQTYYRVWLSQPYVLDGMVGSGVFGLSEAGLRTVGEFPGIIADDEYVRTRFPSVQRRRVAVDGEGKPVSFTMFPPRDLASLIRIESRQRAGMADLKAHFGNTHTDTRMTSGGSLIRTIGKGNSLFGVGVYLAVKVAGRIRYRWSRARGTQQRWLRDDSSRQVTGD